MYVYGGPPTSLLACRPLSVDSLTASLDDGRRAALEAVRSLAFEAGVAVYLVGGPVRDALLGSPLLDLDFSVVGDAIGLARRVAEVLDGRVTTHSRFGTATVAFVERRIDLVTARRETYAQPGQLPQVAPGSIADDLARRDFTINAMALPLSPDGPGILELHGGLDDLEAGLIRSLHRGSFVDDPTRLLRAVRYEQRFGFRIEQDSLADMTACVAGGYMDGVSGDRWRHELERILEEHYPGPPLSRASELGLLAGIHPSLAKASSGGLRKLSPLTGESRLPIEPEADDWLAALFSPLTFPEAESVIQGLRLSGRRAVLARDTIAVRESEPEIRAASQRLSELSGLLSGLEPASVTAWAKLTDDSSVAAALRRYADELRHVRPCLSGETLLEMGVPQGPLVGAILAGLRDARLDGLVNSKDEEAALAQEWLSRHRAKISGQSLL